MTTARGWCPSVHAPMQSGDGWLSRVKPAEARLSAQAAGTLADAALRHGSGVIELTNRGNLQVRGLSAASARPFAGEMVAAGLADADPAVERRRNVLASPLAGIDRTVAPETDWLARAVAGDMAADAALAALDDKFLVVVDGGGALPLAAVRADLALRAAGGDGWALRRPGEPARLYGTAAAARAAARETMRACLGTRRAPRTIDAVAVMPRAVGAIGGALGFGLPFGQLHAATLLALADAATRHGDGELRVSPFRALLLGGVRDTAAVAAAVPGLIADPADPRLALTACAGAPACASASVRTRAVAAQAGAMFAGLGPLHLSGCAKGCAHPGVSPVTLVGQDGLWNVVLDGRAADAPHASGLTLAEAASFLRRRSAAA